MRFTYAQPVPPHCPHWDCAGPDGATDVGVLELDGGGEEEGAEVGEEGADETGELDGDDGEDEDGGAVPPDPGEGPAIEVVMGASSTKIPDQYQSSGAAFVPPLGRRRTPMCL